jgi:hypothetical protein
MRVIPNSMLAFLVGFTLNLGLSCAAQADWSGTYTSTSVLSDGYTHTEIDVVTGLSVSGMHTFTNETSGGPSGSFEWTGTLSESPDWTDGHLTGSGMIHNLGDRPFTITDGGLWLDDNNTYHLWWVGIDPVYGQIGWETSKVAAINLSPSTIAPMDGLWIVDSENTGNPGRGFQIETRNGVMVFTYYGYDNAGRVIWYLSAGALAGSQYSSTLDKYENGISMGGTYHAANANGNDGTLSITFTSSTTGTITFPGEPTKNISKFLW